MPEKITDHFLESEFIVSAEHPELLSGIQLSNCDRVKLFYLCQTFLEPIRAHCGNSPVRTLSGKRDITLNTAVKGADDTDHFYQDEKVAIDFDFFEKHFLLWQAYILIPKLSISGFGQSILYLNSEDLSNPLFLHFSLPTRKHSSERLITIDGNYYNIYTASERYPEISHILFQELKGIGNL